MDDQDKIKERRRVARLGCQRSAFGHGETKPGQLLAALAAEDVSDEHESYGSGGVVSVLEAEVAELLGKPAAVLMPTGIMAQQCVLRVWTDRVSSKRVAVHGLSHFVRHEQNALPLLHGLELEHLSDEPRQPTPADLAAMSHPLGAVTFELPLRDGGHRLPTWDELVVFSQACKDRDTPLHIDGARLWESTPHLGHSLAEVAALADSVYVSFYKGLGGLAGATVAGPEDVIADARRWQRRHGGNLLTMLPYAVAARAGLRMHLPRMAEYHETAVLLAKALTGAGLSIDPDPPHTNAFRVFAPRGVNDINERLLTHLEDAHEALTAWWAPSEVPGWSRAEFTVGSATCTYDLDRLAQGIADTVLGRSGPA